jgi:cysteine desulfurase
MGGTVMFVEPDHRGLITPEAVATALRPETVFVSVSWANSEIGIIQPISQIAKVIRAHEKANSTQVLLHTDAGQSPLYLPTLINSLGVDLMTLDSGKFYGPRGVGALFVGKRAELSPIMLGGAQERGLRAGTENVALAAGFAAALTVIAKERSAQYKKLEKLRNDLFHKIEQCAPGVELNGSLEHSLPHILNVSVPGIQSEYVVLAFDRLGISLSTKSACKEGKEPKSHVIKAIIKDPSDLWRASTSLRFSLGRTTTGKDVAYVANVFAKALMRRG